MDLRFAKMCGCGNDFIVIDNRDDIVPEPRAEFSARHCARHMDVGADGVLLIEPSSSVDFRMRIFNADGSEAEMCGNGARCAAMFAFERGIAPQNMRIETLAGIVAAEVAGDEVTVAVGAVPLPDPEMTIEACGEALRVHFIEVGVPHTIVFSEDADSEDVAGVGRAVRHHESFQPRGTNADFVQVTGPDEIRLRTYERGVEAETLACGTGAIAAAVVSHVRRDVNRPVSVRVNGGLLIVSFDVDEAQARDVRLCGDAVTIYEGTLRAL